MKPQFFYFPWAHSPVVSLLTGNCCLLPLPTEKQAWQAVAAFAIFCSCPRASKDLLSFLHNHKLIYPALRQDEMQVEPGKGGTSVSAAGARSCLTGREFLWRRIRVRVVYLGWEGSSQWVLGHLQPDFQGCTAKFKHQKKQLLWSIIIYTSPRKRPLDIIIP